MTLHFEYPDLKMTQDLANHIRDLRCVQGCTWRRVAELIYEHIDGNWNPPSNQIVGMDLCEMAMMFLNEEVEDGWN